MTPSTPAPGWDEARAPAIARVSHPDVWECVRRGTLHREDEDVQNSLEQARAIIAADPATARLAEQDALLREALDFLFRVSGIYDGSYEQLGNAARDLITRIGSIGGDRG